jgi:hypothetical protein
MLKAILSHKNVLMRYRYLHRAIAFSKFSLQGQRMLEIGFPASLRFAAYLHKTVLEGFDEHLQKGLSPFLYTLALEFQTN